MHVECIPSTRGPEMMLVLQGQQVSSISSTWEPDSASFPSHFDVIHVYRFKQPLFSTNRQTFPTRYFLPPKHVPTDLPRSVSRTRDQRVGVRTDFVQQEPLDLQCLTMIWATCVVEDVSINLDSYESINVARWAFCLSLCASTE